MRTIVLSVCATFLLSAVAASAFTWTGTAEVIRSVSLTHQGKLEVIRTRGTGMMYPEGGEPPHYAYRDIYGVKDGRIILEKTEEGEYSPESTRSVPAQFQWSK